MEVHQQPQSLSPNTEKKKQRSEEVTPFSFPREDVVLAGSCQDSFSFRENETSVSEQEEGLLRK